MKKMIIAAVAVLLAASTASACAASVGTATTSVYIRSIETGEIVGSMHKGDKAVVSGKLKNGYKRVSIGGTDYAVYGEYLSIAEENLDETPVMSKPGRSRSKEKAEKKNSCVSGAKKKKIRGSDFDGMYFW